jgi:hypothetical protein
MDSFAIISEKESVSWRIIMVRSTRGSGKMTLGQAKDTNGLPMDAFTMVCTRTGRCRDKGNILGQMGKFMKGNGSTILSTVQECGKIRKVTRLSESGRKDKPMALEFSLNLMEVDTREHSSTL